MSTTVDNRVVSMEFDNKRFEENVKESMTTLEKLKRSLNFKGASKGLETLSVAASNQSRSFEDFEITATSAGFSFRDVWLKVSSIFEYQIAGRIISAAKNMVSALAIDPIKTGLSEYETQLNSVQTILANTESKGSTLKDVNAALDELNTYADKTIYNFTEMTRNIGTFTAAGVDLDTSVSAIKGIANLAAVSGSTSQQASTAMYQLSQALASGTVKLMDWNSVVNAGMGGQVFQDALKETARVHGVAIDDIIKKQGSFRESLSEGWLTSEILTETLAKFTGDLSEEQLKSMGYTEKQIEEIIKLGNSANDAATKVKTFTQLMDTLKEGAQSGWAQTWELIFGDFEEAKSFWTKVSDEIGGLIGNSAENRNKLLSGALNSGWDNFLGEGIANEAGYQNWIKTVAKGHNVAIDDMVEKYGSLDKAIDAGIKDGTISHEILAEALNHLTDETAGLSDEQLKNLGLTKDQATALTEFNEKIQNGDASIESFYKKMQRLSGRELLFNIEYDEEGLIKYNERTGALVNIYGALMKIVNTLKDAWSQVFPKATSEQLYNLIDGFRKLTSKLILSDENAEKLKRAFVGVFSVFDIIITVIKDLVSGFIKIIKNFDFIIDAVYTVIASIGDLITKFRDFVKESGFVSSVIGIIAELISNLVSHIKNLASATKTKLETANLDKFSNALKKVWSVVSKIFGKIKNAAVKFIDVLKETFSGFNLDSFLALFNSGLLAGLLVIFNKFVNIFKKPSDKLSGIMDGLKDIVGGVNDILDGVRGTLEAYQTKIKAEVIKTIAVSVAILAASLLVLSFIDKDKLNGALAAITILMGVLVGTVAMINKIGKGGFASTKGSISLIKLATTLLILSFALKKIGELTWDEIGRGLTGLTGALVILLGALTLLKLIGKIEGKGDIINTNARIMALATGLLIMGIALKSLSGLSWDEIGRGLTAVGGALTLLIGSLTILQLISKIEGKGQLKLAKTLGVMISSLVTVATVLALMSKLSWDEIARGLTGMSASLAILLGCIFLMSKMKANESVGVVGQILAITAGLYLMSIVLSKLSDLSWDDIWRSLTAMTLSLIALIGSVAVASKIKAEPGSIIRLMGTTVVLLTLAGILKILATMSWDDILRSLTVMTISLTVLVGALAILSKLPSSSLSGAGSLLVLAIAIGALIPSLIILGNLKTGVIVKGLFAIAGAIAILGAAAFILQPIAPILLIISGSILMLGAACLAAGVGLILIGTGLTILAGGLGTLSAVIAASGAALIGFMSALGKKLINLIPSLMEAFGRGIVALCSVIGNSATAIGQAIVAVLLAVIDICVQVVPKLAQGFVQLLVGVLGVLAEYTPVLAEMLFDIVLKILTAIGDFIPKLIQVAVDIFMKFLKGLIDALQSIDPNILVDGIKAVGFVTVLLLAFAAMSALIPSAMLGVLGLGVLIAELALVLAAIGALARIPGLIDIVADGGKLLQAVGNAIGQFIGGVLGGIGEGLTSSLPSMASDLSTFMTNLTPFLDGLKLIDSSLLENAKTLASLLLVVTAASIVERLTAWLTGGSSMEDFANEIAVFGTGLKKFASEVEGIDGNNVKAAAEAGKILGEMAQSIPTSGGLWEVIAGKKNLNDFGEQLSSFGKGVKNFANEVQGVDGENVKVAAEAGKTLAEMAQSIPTSGGLWDLIGDDENSLSLLADQLELFGKAIGTFSNSTAGINLEAVQNGAKAGRILSEMASTIPVTGGLWNALTGNNSVSSFEQRLTSFSSAIKAFALDIASVGNISNITSEIKNLGNALNSFGEVGVGSLVNTLNRSRMDIRSLTSEMLQSAIDVANEKSVTFETTGKMFIEKFVTSIVRYGNKIKTAFLIIVKECEIAIKSIENYNSFYNSGKYLVEGFASGIDKNTFLASAKAKAMASAAATAAAEELDEHSPSKVGYKIGDFFGLAFVNAIDSYRLKAYDSGSDVAVAAKEGMSSAISKVAQTIENGIDDQITIRPVLDLTEVSNGVNAMNGMLNTNPSIGVMAKVDSISSSMNKNQNGGNSDVVTAIDNLKDTMLANAGNTTNIINGITYDDGSEIQTAIETIVRAIIKERRS